MPERSITSITPIHRHSTPIMDRHSSTPAAAPSSAPRATAGPFPAPWHEFFHNSYYAFIITQRITLSTLDIAERDPLEIYVDGPSIILNKYQPACIFCGDSREITSFIPFLEIYCQYLPVSPTAGNDNVWYNVSGKFYRAN